MQSPGLQPPLRVRDPESGVDPMSQDESARIHVWLERLQGGDERALNNLIIHFERRLRSLTRKMIREYPLVQSCEQTDDVFQNAVLRLCRALKAVSPRSTRDLIRLSAAQIRRELQNLARFYRSRPRMLDFDQDKIDSLLSEHARSIGDSVIDVMASGGNSSSRLDQWTEFHEAAASLPEPQKEVFDLLWYHGFSQDEVATVQGVCVRTIKKRWNAARLAIFDSLGGHLPGH
jgi:RNA polymerase sigma factor (sigma-70 family)